MRLYYSLKKSLNRLNKVTIYNKFDIIATYHRIKIKKKTNKKQRFEFDTIILNIKFFFSI